MEVFYALYIIHLLDVYTADTFTLSSLIFLASSSTNETHNETRVLTEVSCVDIYTHAKRSHTHVKGPVVHVRVRWIMETPN